MKFLFILAFFVSSAMAAKQESMSTKVFADLIKQYATDYQYQKSSPLKLNLKSSFRPCEDEPEGESCLNTVCAKLPSYKCDDQDEIGSVLEACRGSNASCVTEVCEKLPSYKCDDLDELSVVARSCKRVGRNCIKSFCSRMPSYKCDDLDEMEAVAVTCQHTSGSCIDAVCARLPSYKCDDYDELKAVALQCNGRD